MKPRIAVALLVLLAFTAAFAAAKQPPVTDDSINDAVMRKLNSDADVKGGAFKIDVKAGVVTLNGKVESQKQKDRAGKLTKKVKGVKSVDNQLTVVGKGGR
jgi:hyperosmotically inducible protein